MKKKTIFIAYGNWHYDAELYERGGYKSAATVLHTLCDVVSKNGNLMVSVPMRGDGTIDDKADGPEGAEIGCRCCC